MKTLLGKLLLLELKDFLLSNGFVFISQLNFRKEYFISDLEIVRVMIQKESYGFNTYHSSAWARFMKQQHLVIGTGLPESMKKACGVEAQSVGCSRSK